MKEGDDCPKCGQAKGVRVVWTFGAYVECPACGFTDFAETVKASLPSFPEFAATKKQ